MIDFLAVSLGIMADTSSAVFAMREYVTPTIHALAALASIVCVFFLVNGGYQYMTSSGKPDALDHAKRVLRNALLGLIIVLGATVLTSILTQAYGIPAEGRTSQLPQLQAIPAQEASSGLIDVLIKAITGLLSNIIQAVATPFLAALDFFTKSTPLMAENPSVFNLWLAIVGITNVLFIIVLALIGFHVMSATSFGFDEIEFKHLLPRIGLVFLLINTSIFAIDGIIELSNALIASIGKIGGATSVWETLTTVVKETSAQGVAALLMMLAFLIFSVFLLVYYVLRLVTLFVGAVLSPLVILVWLVPGFRDFSESAIKTYITTIFVLFVHVIILLLAASLFTGMAATGANQIPDTLISMIIGLATILALLKAQNVMMQFSFVSMGSRNARKLGGQFMNGVSYMTSKKTEAVNSMKGKVTGPGTPAGTIRSKRRIMSSTTGSYSVPHSSQLNKGVKVTRVAGETKTSTGTSIEASKPTPRKTPYTKGTEPKLQSKKNGHT